MSATPNLGDKLAYSVPEFCQAVGIGRSRAYEEIKAGRLRVTKAGRRTLIAVEEARTWLNLGNQLSSGRKRA
jgi:excisionase family DNA binding protein